MSPLKEWCGNYKCTQNELLAFVNLTKKQTNKQKYIYAWICTKYARYSRVLSWFLWQYSPVVSTETSL